MDYQLLKYQISPRIVETNKPQTVSVKGVDNSCLFFDDIEYLVTVISVDGYSYKDGLEFHATGRDTTTVYYKKPENGVISFTHTFNNEGEWVIKIERADKESDAHILPQHVQYWKGIKNRVVNGFNFVIYALNSDLYGKKPFKGNMHAHSFGSDGLESGEFVACRHREYGYDFFCLTDHYFMQPSLDLVEKLKEVNGGLKVFVGEEVHPTRDGEVFHVVNFNGKTSVNKIYNDDPEKAKAEIREIAKTMNTGNEVDDTELAYFKWIFDKIREGGGIAIYPHAFWHVAFPYNVRPKISYEILKRKLCDAYEVFGGMSKRDNLEMTQFTAYLKSQGIDLPIIGSSDAHSSLSHGNTYFDNAFTIVFSEDKDKIPSAILEKSTVAVANFHPEDKTVYGDLRLVHYAYFLLEHYYPMHDDYCKATGRTLLKYHLGDSDKKQLVESLDAELKEFDKLFFGN
jgi:predicted metal-dependent phosphoesterase TrpH